MLRPGNNLHPQSSTAVTHWYSHIINAFQWGTGIRLLIVSEQMVVDVMTTED